MVKKSNKNIADKIAKHKETDSLSADNSTSQFSNISAANPKELNTNDDLIVSLSDAYENKRARQVFEWERLRRQNIQFAA